MNLLQDDNGNKSSGRWGFIFSLIVFHLIYLYIVYLLGKENIAGNLTGLSALYVAGTGSLGTFKVQSRKGEYPKPGK